MEAIMSDYEALLAEATQLPLGARIQLIEALWDTVPADALPPLSDEWLAEIERRTAEYDAGNEQAIPWEQVRRDARLRAGMTAER
jgi:putative addiction module component (TIGR02574 family)